jgi:hypothetical protein
MWESTNPRYKPAKLLEYNVLEYLNRVQPFRFYNTLTNEILPISPYKPSVYKYTTFDFYNDYIILDLKTLSKSLRDDTEQCVYANCSKIKIDHMIFLYSFENYTNEIVDLHYINYNFDRFDTFWLTTLNSSVVHNIPKWINKITYTPCEYFVKLDTTYPHSHQIDICYNEEYQQSLINLIAKDLIAYKRSWGILGI